MSLFKSKNINEDRMKPKKLRLYDQVRNYFERKKRNKTKIYRRYYLYSKLIRWTVTCINENYWKFWLVLIFNM